MKPQNHSERQSAIYRFWAIYIVAIMLPMVAFYFMFKDGGGGNSKDFDKLKNQIYEFNKVAQRVGEIDSLTTSLVDLDNKYKNLALPDAERLKIEGEINGTIELIDRVKSNLNENVGKLKFEETKKYYGDIKSTINNIRSYHESFIANVKGKIGTNTENKELEQVRAENNKLITEIGTLKGEIRVLEKKCQ